MDGITGSLSLDNRVDLARGGTYEMLALAFAYPSEERHEILAELCDQAIEASVDESLGISSEFLRFAEEVEAASAVELTEIYTTLFSRSVVVPACETAYVLGQVSKSRELADIAGFYRAFGLKVAVEQASQTDFIGSELQFMSVLISRKLAASLQGLAEQEQICTDAERKFVGDHLGRWVRSFAEQTSERSGPGFYSSAANLTAAFVQSEIRRLRVSPDIVENYVPDLLEDEDTTCGGSEALGHASQ